jgi:hypothetical protein
VGDATGDGFDDVAVGVPGENGVGAVVLLKGSSAGIATTGHTARGAVTTTTVNPKRLGQAVLMITDLTGDGRGEIVVADTSAAVNGQPRAGAVSVWRGRTTGLSNTSREWWHQDRASVPGAAEEGDRFGSWLTAGDIIGSSRRDIVVGIPYEDVGTLIDAGAFTVLTGGATTSGLTGAGSVTIDQNSLDVTDGAQSGDRFGWSLQVVIQDGVTWLSIAAPYDKVSQADGARGSGMVTSFRKDGSVLTPASAFDGTDMAIFDVDTGEQSYAISRLGWATPEG